MISFNKNLKEETVTNEYEMFLAVSPDGQLRSVS